MPDHDFDIACMRQALALAAQGRGQVEPNPMVGCIIARNGVVIAEGFHERYGEAHAEANALRKLGGDARGCTLYVTLEPCCHHGKTPPCSEAVIAAGVSRAVVALRDPFPQVAGGGLQQLKTAGIQVDVGLLEAEAKSLNSPYLMLVEQQRPWTIAKWAMTLDGKLATYTGDSQWISNERSRDIVHALRGRMDAIIVGRGTAERDDPLLTARPAGVRVATRIVLDSHGDLSLGSQLARTAREVPVLVAVGPQADADKLAQLTAAGCEIWQCQANDSFARLASLWRELGRRRFTNVLVEGGAKLLGSLFDARLIDEVHAFVSPKLVGGGQAPSPIAGVGLESMSQAWRLYPPEIEILDGDLYIHGRVTR